MGWFLAPVGGWLSSPSQIEGCQSTAKAKLSPPLHAARYHVAGKESCLVDELAVSYTPSARALVAARKAASARSCEPKLGGVANPLPHSQPIPYARDELEVLAQLFPPGPHVELYEHGATKEAVLAMLPQVTHLHFSCYGCFDAYEPFESYLDMAHEEHLTLHEILAQDSLANVRLAVLSACQTAVTEFARLPDEAIGWPSAFLQVGVPGVLGTLWPVNSVSTALLMVKFYEFYLKADLATGMGPMTPAHALGRAQRWLCAMTREEAALLLGVESEPSDDSLLPRGKEPFSEPQYWAPFVFVGV